MENVSLLSSPFHAHHAHHFHNLPPAVPPTPVRPPPGPLRRLAAQTARRWQAFRERILRPQLLRLSSGSGKRLNAHPLRKPVTGRPLYSPAQQLGDAAPQVPRSGPVHADGLALSNFSDRLTPPVRLRVRVTRREGQRLQLKQQHPEHPKRQPWQQHTQQEDENDEQDLPEVLCSIEVLSGSRHVHRGPLRRLGWALRHVGAVMRPQGPGHNDTTASERTLNVLTCGAFFLAGRKIVRLCRSLAARRFGWSFLAVGAIATLYHSSWGRFRHCMRKADYYSIAASAMVLRSAVCGPLPAWLTAACALAIPLRPTLVTSANFTAVEVRYLLLALSQPSLLAGWAAHLGLTLAASACFLLEDTPLVSWCQFSHAAFHGLSAAAFMTLPGALDHLATSREQAAGLLAAA